MAYFFYFFWYPFPKKIDSMWLKKLPKNVVGPILLVYVLIYATGLIFSVALLLGI